MALCRNMHFYCLMVKNFHFSHNKYCIFASLAINSYCTVYNNSPQRIQVARPGVARSPQLVWGFPFTAISYIITISTSMAKKDKMRG